MLTAAKEIFNSDLVRGLSFLLWGIACLVGFIRFHKRRYELIAKGAIRPAYAIVVMMLLLLGTVVFLFDGIVFLLPCE